MRTLLALLLLVASAEAGQLDATWTAPTTNTDGSALTDLASYRVYYVQSTTANPCPGNQFSIMPSPTTTPAPNTRLTLHLPGLVDNAVYRVQVSAIDTSGAESACSGLATATSRPTIPTAIMNPRVQ